MDWTALQRISLALTSGAPCLAVQSAREQQSLHTWFVQYGSSGIAAMVLCAGYLTSLHAAATFY